MSLRPIQIQADPNACGGKRNERRGSQRNERVRWTCGKERQCEKESENAGVETRKGGSKWGQASARQVMCA